MPQILLIADDHSTRRTTEQILQHAGHSVVTAQSGLDGLRLLRNERPALVITDLSLSDVSNLDVLKATRQARRDVPVIVLAGHDAIRDAVDAIRHGAIDVVAKPILDDQMLKAVGTAIAAAPDAPAASMRTGDHECEAHAAARWARCVVRIIDSPKDPRTLSGWSRWIIASEGALRNWCLAAKIPPRRSLVFARMLRVVCRSEGGRHAPRNLLDVVDPRTLDGLLRYAGFEDEHTFPHDIADFLARQRLVVDPDMISEVRKALVASMLLPLTSAPATHDRQTASVMPRPMAAS